MQAKKPAKRLTLTETDLRVVARWAAASAARALPLFEAVARSDTRARNAIEGARAFARSGKRTASLRALAWGALAASREVRDPIASAAARAAGLAAASAYTHPIATPHQINHLLGPIVYAAHARELAADDPRVGDKELQLALRRATPPLRKLVGRMPARREGRGRLAQMFSQLDAGLRAARSRSTPGSRRPARR
ncbi:MAG: hypothetical protein HOV81_12130 [Kofleriaceae bacterium]|nr:hypothetical protein [Kofleriaceae bacterium]